MPRKRVLIVHPYVYASGGGNAVAAWALEALRGECDVTLAALAPVDCAAVNQSFGTSLRDGDFVQRIAPHSYQLLLRSFPTPGALLQACVTARWAGNLDRLQHFDVLLSTQNEVDFGRTGLQYVHYPWSYLPRPQIEYRWYHFIPAFLSGYRSFCQRLARATDEGLRRNISLANSAFVADRIKQVHGTDSVILYPPVPGEFPEIPWDQRLIAAVAVGRMHGCKRWELAVEIVDLVRRGGLDLGLTLIAHRDDPEYGRRIEALAQSRPWFRILSNISRTQLVEEVARHRYGLHTMEFEHFGIAPAELLRAGTIPFVHDSGGPVEIVGGHPALRFRDAADAAEKITAAITTPALEEELRRFVEQRRDCFSAERFCESLRDLVASFDGSARIADISTARSLQRS